MAEQCGKPGDDDHVVDDSGDDGHGDDDHGDDDHGDDDHGDDDHVMIMVVHVLMALHCGLQHFLTQIPIMICC